MQLRLSYPLTALVAGSKDMDSSPVTSTSRCLIDQFTGRGSVRLPPPDGPRHMR